MDRLTGWEDEHTRTFVEKAYDEISGFDRAVDLNMILNRLAKYEDVTDGISFDRLREICEAERDGRCVVLPCKVGEIVYVSTSQVCDDCIISGVIQYFVVYETFTDAAVIFNQGASDAFIARVKTENIGKTVFLTREEAEAALRKEQGDEM